MNITEYVLTAIFIFLLYFAVRSGVHHHKTGGYIIGLIFIIAGAIFSGIDGTLLVLGGVILLIITAVEPTEENENE